MGRTGLPRAVFDTALRNPNVAEQTMLTWVAELPLVPGALQSPACTPAVQRRLLDQVRGEPSRLLVNPAATLQTLARLTTGAFENLDVLRGFVRAHVHHPTQAEMVLRLGPGWTGTAAELLQTSADLC